MAAAAARPEPLRQRQSPFLRLPIELVLETIAHLSQDRHTLCSLARTCLLVQPSCEKHIYSSIELLSTDHLEAICYAFAQRPERIEAVHVLKIFYKYHKRLAATIEQRKVLNECVKQMKGLKEWHVESPFDNFKWYDEAGSEWVGRDMEDFRQALETASLHKDQPLQKDVGLAQLKKLIIHSHGASSDFWHLEDYHCLFRHPSLRYLHVSCVTFPTDLPELEPFATTTPLTTLIFDECELEPGSLRRILCTPKSLKHLTLGENVHNTHRSRSADPKLSSAAEAAMRALLPVAHSLETLTHFDPMFLNLADPDMLRPVQLSGPGMREFHHLRFLECDRCSFLHQGIIMSRTRAPPNLEILRLRTYLYHPGDFFDVLPCFTPYTLLPALNTLEFVQPRAVTRPIFTWPLANRICNHDRVRERHAYAYKLWKCGIRMKMYAEMQKKQTYHPPYLHEEPLPQLLCVYDSQEVGFYRDLEDDDDDDVSEQQEQTGTVALPAGGTASRYPLKFDTALQPSLAVQRPPTASSNGRVVQGSCEPRETDQLNNDDILRLKDKVNQSLQTYLGRKTLLIYCSARPVQRPVQVVDDDDDDDDDDDEDDQVEAESDTGTGTDTDEEDQAMYEDAENGHDMAVEDEFFDTEFNDEEDGFMDPDFDDEDDLD